MAYIDEVCSSIGINVKIGNTTLAGVYNFGDLGADAQELDCTPLPSSHALKVPGLIDEPQWEIDYYYNATDFDAIETIRTAGSSVALEVTMKNGDKFTNTGKCGANYVTGTGVNGMTQCKATFMLGSQTGWTRTAANP